MRQSPKQNRARSKGGRKSNGPSLNRVYESTGPEGKVRGTPQQIIEKYLSLARDKATSGDRVMSESFLQHAEHYVRILGAAQQANGAAQQQCEEAEPAAAEPALELEGAEAGAAPLAVMGDGGDVDIVEGPEVAAAARRAGRRKPAAADGDDAEDGARRRRRPRRPSSSGGARGASEGDAEASGDGDESMAARPTRSRRRGTASKSAADEAAPSAEAGSNVAVEATAPQGEAL